MKCNYCNSEWNIGAGASSSHLSCPFCGRSLVKEEAPKFYENSKDALAAIMNRFGADVLLGKLNAHFSDFAPSVPQNIKKLVYSVYEHGAAHVMKKNLNASQADKESAVKVAIRILTDAFIVRDMAEGIVYEFASALGWEVAGPEALAVAPVAGKAAEKPTAAVVPARDSTFIDPRDEQLAEYIKKAAEKPVAATVVVVEKPNKNTKQYQQPPASGPSPTQFENLEDNSNSTGAIVGRVLGGIFIAGLIIRLLLRIGC